MASMESDTVIDDDGFEFKSFPDVEEDGSIALLKSDDDVHGIIRAVSALPRPSGTAQSFLQSSRGQKNDAKTETMPSVVDDFIRNFFIRAGLTRTLDCFNTEWYEKNAKGTLPVDSFTVPDVYIINHRLEEECNRMKQELVHAQEIAAKAQGTWDRFRKERDFHRMNHKRVLQEKDKLLVELRRLKKHYEQYEPTLEELRTKYEMAAKEKMLFRLERDRLAARVLALETQMANAGIVEEDGKTTMGPAGTGIAAASHLGASVSDANQRRMDSRTGSRARTRSTGLYGSATATNTNRLLAPTAASKARADETAVSYPKAMKHRDKHIHTVQRVPDSKLPAEDGINPFLRLMFEPARAANYKSTGTIRSHGAPISSLAFHPTKPIYVTTSDDLTWRLWTLAGSGDAELLMNGEGHKSWLADADFHPSGKSLATSSGDGIVKIWSLTNASCLATLSDHTQATWGVSWHSSGDFLASCSMDHTVKLWDANTGKVRQTFRGHVDSVNTVQFQPFSSLLATASGDKTISMWDARSGLCVQTFYGHENAVSDLTFSLAGDTIVSCDADGSIRVWDVRKVSERASVSVGQQSVHSVALDRSASILVSACDDGVVRVFNIADATGPDSATLINSLKGHEDAVQAVAFDPTAQCLVSGGSDATVRIWSEGAIVGIDATEEAQPQ